MKSIKCPNALLTVIAACLVIIAMFVLGLIPKAQANDINNKYATVPVNADGSINVKLVPNSTVDVNIESCDANAFSLAEPIEVKIK